MAETSIAVFHPGTQHSWQTATALQRMHRLAFFATSIFYNPDRWPYRIERYLPGALYDRVHAGFQRFRHDELDPALVRTAGTAEWIERLVRRTHMRKLANRIDAYGNRRFIGHIGASIASDTPFALWGYDSSSREAFRLAKAHGRKLILDRTIGDWRAYNLQMDEVYDQYPEFFIDPHFRVGQAKIDADDEEYALADVILTGSDFAADTVRHHAIDKTVAARVRTLNYPYDDHLFGSQAPPHVRSRDAPLEFLFLGQAGPRKGIHLLLKAFARIPASAARLTVVGDLQVPRTVFARYADRITYRPTVARSAVPAIMAAADVIVFPSYFEGSALTLIEGLASGLGLIQSVNAGVGVTPETGLSLPVLTEDAVYCAMMQAIDDRERTETWRSNAQREAARYTFDTYCAGIERVLNDFGI